MCTIYTRMSRMQEVRKLLHDITRCSYWLHALLLLVYSPQQTQIPISAAWSNKWGVTTQSIKEFRGNLQCRSFFNSLSWVCLGVRNPVGGQMTRFLLLSDSSRFVTVPPALSDQTTGLYFTTADDLRQRSNSSVRIIYILLSAIRHYPTRRVRSQYSYPPRAKWLSCTPPPPQWVPVFLPLGLAGLRWRYSNLPPWVDLNLEIQSILQSKYITSPLQRPTG
jgi:hypothetical protein